MLTVLGGVPGFNAATLMERNCALGTLNWTRETFTRRMDEIRITRTENSFIFETLAVSWETPLTRSKIILVILHRAMERVAEATYTVFQSSLQKRWFSMTWYGVLTAKGVDRFRKTRTRWYHDHGSRVGRPSKQFEQTRMHAVRVSNPIRLLIRRPEMLKLVCCLKQSREKPFS